MPAVPLPFIAIGALYTNVMGVRSLVIQIYEQELRRRLASGFDSSKTKYSVVFPFGNLAQNKVWWSHRGNAAVIVMFTSLAATYVSILVVSFKFAHRTEPAM